jgi:predicted DNA-binding transcriptional regulator YafY
MARRDSIQRINIIVSFLRKKPASFLEIIGHLEKKSMDDGYNYVISQRTFKRDLELILSLLNVEIEFSHTTKKYVIVEDSKEEINLRIMEAYDTFNALKIANDISQYIFFESRRANGSEHLSPLLYGLKNKKMIKCTYQKFWEEEPNNRLLMPLALKETRQRWYLIAKDQKDNIIKTFGLDRMSELSISDQGFVYPKDANIEEKFKDCYGIISDDDYAVENVLLSFSRHQAKYIKSMPIHQSQEVVSEDENECLIMLRLKPTHDFMMEILSFGKEVEVLEPICFREEIRNRIAETLEKYKE